MSFSDRTITIKGICYNPTTKFSFDFLGHDKVGSDQIFSRQLIMSENLPNSQVQIAMFDMDSTTTLLVKNDPNSRMCRTFDSRRKDVRLFHPLNNRLNLYKFEDNDGHYWTILDIQG